MTKNVVYFGLCCHRSIDPKTFNSIASTVLVEVNRYRERVKWLENFIKSNNLEISSWNEPLHIEYILKFASTLETISIETFGSIMGTIMAEIVYYRMRIEELENFTKSNNLEISSWNEPLHIEYILNVEALIERSRDSVATSFLEMNPEIAGDVLLFIDDDIVFNREIVERIVEKCLEKKSVVGGMYITRKVGNEELKLTARLYPDTLFSVGSNELVEVDLISTGFMAIHRDVLEAVSLATECFDRDGVRYYNFFGTLWTKDNIGDFFNSEDWAFCQRAKKLGFKMWLDPQICLGHVGSKVWTLRDLQEQIEKQNKAGQT